MLQELAARQLKALAEGNPRGQHAIGAAGGVPALMELISGGTSTGSKVRCAATDALSSVIWGQPAFVG